MQRDWKDWARRVVAHHAANQAAWAKALEKAGGDAEAAREIMRTRSRVRWARAKARRIGLAYWPALAFGPEIDPQAYLAAEQILAAGGPKWGFIGPKGEFHHGGWDSKDHHGLSAHFVAQAWFAAGCQDGKKFRLQIKVKALAKKSEAVKEFAARIRARHWAHRNRLAVRFQLSNQVLRVLGRLPWYCRWAALHEVARPQDENAVIRARHLNWAAVKVAQKGVRAAAPYIPKRGRWAEFCKETGIPLSVVDQNWPESPAGIPTTTVAWLLGQMASLEPQAKSLPAVALAAVFGRDREALGRFVRAVGGDFSSASIHDAGQLRLPRQTEAARNWAGLLLRDPGMARFLSHADELPEVPKSRAHLFAMRPEIELEGLGLSDREKRDYDRFFAETPHKGFETIPAPGGIAGLFEGQYQLRQLAADDRRQVLSGLMTDCCQHLHGAASSCAKLAWASGFTAIWAVFKGGDMIAQAFVWRSNDGQLVLDSVEILRDHRENPVVEALFKRAAKAVLGRLGVRAVLVGPHPSTWGLKDRVEVPNSEVVLNYTDVGNSVHILAEQNEKPTPVEKEPTRRPVIREELPAPVAVNELAPGSGVYCEHCEAEVHPDCEVCPSCGADIAEWVDDEEEDEEDEAEEEEAHA